MSSPLFHGPGAREDAHEYAAGAGRLLAEPFENGLGVDETREVVSLMGSAVLGSQIGVVILGPMDIMRSSAASDVLLKTLEDFNQETVLPVLWAHDAGNVSPTIRSRCTEVWCPYGPSPYQDLDEEATKLCRAALGRDWSTTIEVLKNWEKELSERVKQLGPEESRGLRYEERRRLLSACAEVLAGAARRGLGWQRLWLSVRETLKTTTVSKGELLTTLLVGAG